MRNKFFFFGDYQRTIDNLGYVVRATIPTMAMRNGDFSAVPNAIYDPTTGAVNGSGRTAFANNQIPQNRISPIARRLLAFIPEPNIAGAPLGQNNYQKAQTREKTTDAFDTKLNYRLSEKDQVSYRLSFHAPGRVRSRPLRRVRRRGQRRIRGHGHEQSLQHRGNWTRVFSPTMVMDVRGGVNYYHNVTVDGRQRADHEHRRRHPGRESRRVHERPVPDSHWRLHRAGARDSRPASRGIDRRKPGTSRRP